MSSSFNQSFSSAVGLHVFIFMCPLAVCTPSLAGYLFKGLTKVYGLYVFGITILFLTCLFQIVSSVLWLVLFLTSPILNHIH